MRRATLFLIALSLGLAALVVPSAAHAAPTRGPGPTALDSPADTGAGGGVFARILDWLVDFATAPADDGDKPLAAPPETTCGEGDIIPTADPNG